MRENGPEAKKGLRATLRRWNVRSGVTFFLLVLAWGTWARGASNGTRAGSLTAEPTGQGTDQGTVKDRCESCHKEIAGSFAQSPHGKAVSTDGGTGLKCEACHGDGKAHADGGGDPGKIFNPAKGDAKQTDQRCLGCHAKQQHTWGSSKHERANVSCTACHRVHGDQAGQHLLKAEETALCTSCHSGVKPAFALPFHHQVEEGRMRCTECHDAHGAADLKGTEGVAQREAVCTKCHTNQGGPFVHEHGVMKTEGCGACHTAHGSSNAHLLNRANVNTICLECHAPSPVSRTGEPIGAAHGPNQLSQPCTSCHAEIHGSNSSADLLGSQEKRAGEP